MTHSTRKASPYFLIPVTSQSSRYETLRRSLCRPTSAMKCGEIIAAAIKIGPAMLVPLARRARSVLRRLVPLNLRSEIPYRLVANRLTRRIYDNLTELDIIEIELHDGSGKTWSTFKTDAPTRSMSERGVEIPWVLSRYGGQRRVLDIGPAYALPLYLRHLRMLRIPQLHGVDLTDKPVKGLIMDRADVSKMPYPDAS